MKKLIGLFVITGFIVGCSKAAEPPKTTPPLVPYPHESEAQVIYNG